MEFIQQYESSSDNEEEPQQQEAPFSFSSKDFYNSNTVAPKDISLSTVQYEASENGHNEERCNTRVSNVSSIDFVEYVSQDFDNISLDNIEHDSTFTPNVSKDNEVVSEPSSSRSNTSLYVMTGRKRQHWPQWLKANIRLELGDCIDTTSNLTEERATAFLKKYNLQDRSLLNLKHVVYNMGRNKN